jgi:hypothetical protein
MKWERDKRALGVVAVGVLWTLSMLYSYNAGFLDGQDPAIVAHTRDLGRVGDEMGVQADYQRAKLFGLISRDLSFEEYRAQRMGR